MGSVSISPFLFVIVAKGLKGLVNKAIENGDYVGCNVNGKCFIDILQFADNTLLVGEGSSKHLWAIKSVLRDFELVSGLGINFYKSKLIGININPNFLEVATSFLSLRSPLLLKFKKRLSSWKGQMLSFGGRITLLKLLLGSLAIFTLSFYKAPMKIIRKITKIQRNFFGADWRIEEGYIGCVGRMLVFR
ncbi:uncharacterized protein LOC131649527 [Vicia villosa]|uniref:uncharacterized protein LOC131649527 n=1 Tax=Vicia villosa TaxID=3911 RepID=UPI00273BECE5|nr:uncharacterized protein LOC131649527 [Vicia villosa]